MVKEKEEYLIYNYVKLISFVGGTLGICVGLSFLSLGEGIINLTELAVNWTFKQTRGHHEKVFLKVYRQLVF